jgi:hypothetical protein
MRYVLPLAAGVPTVQRFRGKCLILAETGAATDVSLRLYRTGESDADTIGDIGRNFSLYSPDAHFVGAEFTSAVPTTIEIIVTEYRVEALDGANLTVSIGASSIPLQVREDVASAGVDNAAVAVTDVLTAVLAANALRKSVRFQNVGADPVAVGFAGLTWAKRCVVLNPGDVFIEERGANLAWSAICAAGLTASVTAQEVLA